MLFRSSCCAGACMHSANMPPLLRVRSRRIASNILHGARVRGHDTIILANFLRFVHFYAVCSCCAGACMHSANMPPLLRVRSRRIGFNILHGARVRGHDTIILANFLRIVHLYAVCSCCAGACMHCANMPLLLRVCHNIIMNNV